MSSATDKSNKVKTAAIMSAETTTGAGSWFRLPPRKTIQIEGITTGTVKIQASNDGTNAVDLVTATADAGYESEAPWNFIRANVTVATDVSVTVTAGYEEE